MGEWVGYFNFFYFRFAFLEDTRMRSAYTPPVYNPIRVQFTRPETQWQRRRREKSAQVSFEDVYRFATPEFLVQTAIFDSDPWLEMKVQKKVRFYVICAKFRPFQPIRNFFDDQIKKAKSAPHLPIASVPIVGNSTEGDSDEH